MHFQSPTTNWWQVKRPSKYQLRQENDKSAEKNDQRPSPVITKFDLNVQFGKMRLDTESDGDDWIQERTSLTSGDDHLFH